MDEEIEEGDISQANNLRIVALDFSFRVGACTVDDAINIAERFHEFLAKK